MTDADFPVPLDNLITYVRTLRPAADALDHLSDAMSVSARIGEQADALIGYFVDQARRSGASWSQIGTSMGVSKQAAQKRFVPGRDIPIGPVFSRFTPRAQVALTEAYALAVAAGSADIDDTHLALGAVRDPDGLAGKAVAACGVSDAAVTDAMGLPRPEPTTAPELADLTFTEAGTRVLNLTLKEALRLGHNYVGTEHLLLAVLDSGGAAARTLTGLGITQAAVEQFLAGRFTRIRQARRSD